MYAYTHVFYVFTKSGIVYTFITKMARTTHYFIRALCERRVGTYNSRRCAKSVHKWMCNITKHVAVRIFSSKAKIVLVTHIVVTIICADYYCMSR